MCHARGGLSVHGCIQSQDYFSHIRVSRTLNKCSNVEVFGSNTVERRQGSADDVVFAPEGARTLHRPEIVDVLDRADDTAIPSRSGTDRAWADGVEIPAGGAGLHLGGSVRQGGGQRPQQLVALLEQVQCGAAGRTRTEPRQLGQEVDQAEDFRAGGAVNHGGLPMQST